MSGSGLSASPRPAIGDASTRYGGIVASSCAFRSRHIQAVSVSAAGVPVPGRRPPVGRPARPRGRHDRRRRHVDARPAPRRSRRPGRPGVAAGGPTVPGAPVAAGRCRSGVVRRPDRAGEPCHGPSLTPMSTGIVDLVDNRDPGRPVRRLHRPHHRLDQMRRPLRDQLQTRSALPGPAPPRARASSSPVVSSCTSCPPTARSRNSASPAGPARRSPGAPPAARHRPGPGPAATRRRAARGSHATIGEPLDVVDRRVPVLAQPPVDLEPAVLEHGRPHATAAPSP